MPNPSMDSSNHEIEIGNFEHAEQLTEKNLDIIAGNLVGQPSSGFGADTNKVTLFYKDGTKETLSTMQKDDVAHVLLDRIANL